MVFGDQMNHAHYYRKQDKTYPKTKGKYTEIYDSHIVSIIDPPMLERWRVASWLLDRYESRS